MPIDQMKPNGMLRTIVPGTATIVPVPVNRPRCRFSSKCRPIRLGNIVDQLTILIGLPRTLLMMKMDHRNVEEHPHSMMFWCVHYNAGSGSDGVVCISGSSGWDD